MTPRHTMPHTMPHTVPTPAELLRDLDRWMAAARYVADHPWRQAIAQTLATEADARALCLQGGTLTVDLARLTHELYNVEALALPIAARANELEDGQPVAMDANAPITRLCRLAALTVAGVAGELCSGPKSRFAAVGPVVVDGAAA
jgi:hypothetical protein